MAWGLWRTYGPAIVGAAAGVTGQNPAGTGASSSRARPSAGVRGYDVSSSSTVNANAPESGSGSDSASIIARRRALEAELAALPVPPSGIVPTINIPMPFPSTSPGGSVTPSAVPLPATPFTSSSASSTSAVSQSSLGFHSRKSSTSYATGVAASGGNGYEEIGHSDVDSGSGGESPVAGTSGGWWWGRGGGAGPSPKGYDRVKND